MASRSVQSMMPAGGESPVSLAEGESAFLANLGRMADSLLENGGNTLRAETLEMARGLGVTDGQLDFMLTWLRCKGDPVLLSETGRYSPRQCIRHLGSPVVLKLLEHAGLVMKNIPSPVMSKEELALTWSMVSRDPSTPESFQKEARQEIAKLMGYYQGVQGDGVNVGVQVVLKGGLDG